MTGLAYPIRLAGFGLRAPKNPVIGMDLAGVVEEVGKDVRRFRPGDEVFGIGKGAYAEYAPALEAKVAPKPSNLTFEQAAVVAISGSTALQAVRDHGKVRRGQKVLIIGASGGVGTYAVQIAKAFGAHVTGVCSTARAEMVRTIGADRVIDYTREDFAEGEHRYDVILDTGGNSSLARLRRALIPKGTLVIVGGEGGGRWLGGTDRQLRGSNASEPEKSQHMSQPKSAAEVVAEVKGRVEESSASYKRAVVGHLGGPEVLEVREEELPEPSLGEVRVRVLATGVSYEGLLTREGVHP